MRDHPAMYNGVSKMEITFTLEEPQTLIITIHFGAHSIHGFI